MDETTNPAAENESPAAPAPAAVSAPSASAEPETAEAFAELLAAAGDDSGPRWKKGEKVQGRVVRVTDEWVFVGLGTKEEGSIRVAEFAAAEGERDAPAVKIPAEGETIEAYVLSVQGGEVILTTRLARKDASKAAMEQAWQSGIPIEGRVTQVVKGGFEVRVAGLRAFCPLSQIDLRWPKQPELYIGQTFSFKVIEYKEKGRNIIVSRRSLVEEDRARQRESLVESIVPGALVTGHVRSIQSFGAFVDLGGIDALIPISEMSWNRVGSPTDVLAEGQQVTAKVLTVDWDKGRVSLSLKSLEEDPWLAAARKYHPGQRLTGTVARLAPFGAFVTVEPGVDGLVHISALGAGKRVGHPKEVLEPGQTVEVEVLGVDTENRRISLSMGFRYAESLGSMPREGEIVEGVVEKALEFGVLVKLPSGHTGLVPNAEMGTPRGTDHAKSFKPGDAMEVLVLGVEDRGRKIRLSRRGVVRKREDDDLKEYSASQAPAQGASTFGTSLGDLLKAKLSGR